MKKNRIFGIFSLYDISYLIVAYVVISVGFGLSVEKNVVSLLASVVGVTAFVMQSKGLFFAPIFSIIYYFLYASIVIQKRLYGDILICAVCFVISVATLIMFFNHKKKDELTVKVNAISKKEYLLLIVAIPLVWLALFFSLRALGSYSYVLNSFSVTACLTAQYLLNRRSKYYSFGFIVGDAITLTIWCITIFGGDTQFLATLVATAMYLVNDIYGLISWNRRDDNIKNDTVTI